jgi:tripartite-type tricarboxylate transporter receptor subunit TctC
MIGLGRMINQPADGQTIGILTSDSLMMAASGAPGFKFSDATTLAVLVRQPSGMFVPTGSKYKTWQDVVNAGKTKPGGVTVAITGAITADDLTVRYLASKNVTLTAVPYTKPGERYQAVVGGHVEMLYEQAGDVRNFLDSGQMRPLVFFAAKRLPPPFADVPVSAEFGYDVLLPQSRAVLVKAGTDPRRLALLKASIDRFATSPEYLKFLDQQLALPDSFMGAQQAEHFLQGEHEVMRKLIATYVKS